MQYHIILSPVIYILYQSSVSNVNCVRATVFFFDSRMDGFETENVKCLDDLRGTQP